MSENWQVGDLALCLKGGELTRTGCLYVVSDFKLNGEQRLEEDGILWTNRTGETILRFVGLPNRAGDWSECSRFRKVTPPKADEFDREVIELMTGRKVPSHA